MRPKRSTQTPDADRRYLQALHTLEPAELNGDLTELATRFLRNPDARAGTRGARVHRENLKVLAQNSPNPETRLTLRAIFSSKFYSF